MIWIGLAIVILTFYLIYKNYEARLVLALSGILMAGIGCGIQCHDRHRCGCLREAAGEWRARADYCDRDGVWRCDDLHALL